ncbi:MAG: hypothetical protein ACK42Z_06270 [Candidatus Kapaibacteriota bacterium]
MKIKKYRAKTVQEGKELILSELGADAVILSTRIIPPMPPDNEELVELVAAIDTEKDVPDFPTTTRTQDDKIKDFLEVTTNIFKELNVIKNFLLNLSDKITYSFTSNLPSDLAEMVKLMIKNGFTSDFALSFIQTLKHQNFRDFEDLRNTSTQLLAEKLCYSQLNFNEDRPNVFVFIGPTATGKTINVVKLGVLYKLFFNSKVTLISYDCKKIGGWEHLQVLSAISNLNSEYVQTEEELMSQVEAHGRDDFILVDTSGGSPRDELFLNELEAVLKVIPRTSIFLVLSTTQSSINFKENVDSFGKLHPNFLILTKFDEVSTIGHIYETLLNFTQNCPLMYFSIGVDIPNSLEPANPNFLKKYLINFIE